VIGIKNLDITLKINDFYFKTKGIKEENELIFSYENTNYKFDLLKLTLEKEDKKTKFLFDFKNNILNLHDKTLNRDINIKLLIKCLQILKNDIIISYQIEEEIFDFLISYTEE